MAKNPPLKRTQSSASSLNIEGYYNCSREEAKELFQPFILLDGMYLVRPSEAQSSNILYTMSITKERKVYNYRIQQDPKTKQYFVQETDKFADVPSLIKAYKEKPINPKLNVILVAPLVQGKKRKQNSQAFLANFNKGHQQQQDFEELPGMHQYLPRSEIKHVMAGYMNRPGTFLLRPSLTSEGSLTLTVVHKYELLNFKITQDPNTREVCVAAKKFTNFNELLEFYKYNPLKIKSRPNENILLTFPLPVDKSLENVHKSAQEELYAELSGVQPLPPDWTEHYDDSYKRNYYYNNKTRETSWTKPVPGPPKLPARPPVSPTSSVGAPSLPPARKPISQSVSAPIIAPPRSRASLAEIPKTDLPPTGDMDADSEYIAVGDIPASQYKPNKLKQPDFEEEDEYILVGSLPPVPEDSVLSDNTTKLSRATSAPVTGVKRMSVIKANKDTMKEEKELLKQQKLDEKNKLKREKEEKKEAAKKSKEEAKRLKGEEAKKKKEEAKRLKEEAKQQKEEEKKRIKEEKQRKKSGAQSPGPESVTLESAPSSSQTMPASMKPGPPSPPPCVDLGEQPSASLSSGPPSPPPRVDLEPAEETKQRASTMSGPPAPPPRVDLFPEEDKPKALTMGGPPAPPPRVDLEPQTNSGPLAPPSHVDLEPQTKASGPPPAPPPPPLSETALKAAANTKSSQQVEKDRKAAEKKRKQEEERLKKEAAKKEKEEAKRQKEEQKRERKMSKSLSKTSTTTSTSDVPTTDVPAATTAPPPPPAGNVPAPPPPPPISGNETSASNVPSPSSTTPSQPILPPQTTSMPQVAPTTSSAPVSPSPPPVAPITPPAAPPAAPPPPPVSPISPATAPAAPPPPPLSPPPPPPPVSSPTSPTSPSSASSRGFSAEDLMAGRNKLTMAAAPIEKAPQKAAGLGGIMQSAFDQFNDKIGAMRSFVEYSDDEDFEDIEEDEDWD